MEFTREQITEFNKKGHQSVAARYARAAEEHLAQADKIMANMSLSDEQRKDLLITALEGGSNYWCAITAGQSDEIRLKTDHLTGLAFAERVWEYVKEPRATVKFIDKDSDDEAGKLTLEGIRKGELVMIEKYPNHYMNVLVEAWDAETADVWFQCAVLGDIIYG